MNLRIQWLFLLCPLAFASADTKATHGLPLPQTSSMTLTSTTTLHADAVVEERLLRERYWSDAGLRLVPYKPNYILPFSYVPRPNRVVNNFLGAQDLQDIEAKFQISLRLPVARGLFWRHGDLSLAYTQVSYWQVYNRKASAPFRETNYEPEAMIAFETDYSLLGLNGRLVSFGVVHQSNGRTEPQSRSWNRVYLQTVLERKNFGLAFRPWVRLPEFETDDNPDIGEYMGNFELRASYKAWDTVWSALIRNNLRVQNKGAYELGINLPFFGMLRSYIQFFNGYGESLLDYNHSTTRIGAGFIFTDWL